jgi:hypothetical protein
MEAFLAKIACERRVLYAVNRRFGDPALCGLTAVAINNWSLGRSGAALELAPFLLCGADALSANSYTSSEKAVQAARSLEIEITSLVADSAAELLAKPGGVLV